jgi:phosphatidylserine/phosphatidylglycerophosphate/cardiolipin synthase-like enzyme
MDSTLYARIKDFALGISESDSAQVKLACSEISSNTPDSAAALQHLLTRALRADFLSLINLLRIPHPELLGPQLFTLLQVVRTTSAEVRPPSLTLAWTGPKSPKLPVRLTEQVLLELIDEAKSELYVVAFAFYKANLVKSAIQRAVARGVRVTMLMESSTADNGTTDFDMVSKLRAELGASVRFLEWPPTQREKDAKGNVGALHVKCAIADRSRAFISSANLTDYAMTLNMELGVELRDSSLVQRLWDHFQSLEGLGILLPVR